MKTIEDFQEVIAEEISNISFGLTPHGLYEPIEYLLNIGGKRIRPALVLCACNIFSENIQNAIPTALGFEIFHNFTLMHDDVMDDSSLRRNNQTVHEKWNVNTAILSGDAMMIKAYESLMKNNADKFTEIFKLFNKTALEVCEGQQFDINFETIDNVSEKMYIEMIRLKTSVLIAACLKAGAIIGGASNSDSDILYDFGINIGLAFQLQDDYLDVYGEPAVFGKENGGDISANKKTFMLIKAIENADDETLAKLNYWLSVDGKNGEKIKSVTNIFTKTGIDKLAKKKIEEYHAKAIIALQKLEVSEEKKSELLKFSKTIKKRNK